MVEAKNTPKPKTKQPMRYAHFLVSHAHYDALREAGEQDDRTFGYMVRQAVIEYLENHKPAPPKAAKQAKPAKAARPQDPGEPRLL